MPIEIFQFRYRADNYGVLIHDRATGDTACVDVGSPNGEAELAALEQTGWSLTQLWITHHHADHIDGLRFVKAATGCRVFGPKGSKREIVGIDHYLEDGDRFEFGSRKVDTLHTPGHTLCMLNYYLAGDATVFTGDTLFSMGCGRIFEGTPAMMYESLMKLKSLPPETAVYFSHEYSRSNADFALSIDANNRALIERSEEVDKFLAVGAPTSPTSIAAELATNPYFRCDDTDIRNLLGMTHASDLDVFTEIRQRKDTF